MNQSRLWSRAGAALTVLALLLGLAADVAEAAKLDRYLKRKMRKASVPGLATAIVVGDEVVQIGSYGWADPGEQIPVTRETLFLIASVSKPVTATIAMRLVDRRLIALDDDINLYLPFEVRNPAYPDEPITLRHLLTHTSSISDDAFYARITELVSVGDWPGSLTRFLTDYLTPGGRYYAADASFDLVRPGTHAAYSNVGFALVGAVVESVAGISFESLSRAELFDLLGMTGQFRPPASTGRQVRRPAHLETQCGRRDDASSDTRGGSQPWSRFHPLRGRRS